MVRTKRMKRLMTLGALLLIFALVGCNNVPQTPTPTEPPVTPPVTPPEEPIEIVRGAPFAINEDLVASMKEYLGELHKGIDPLARGLGGKIYGVENGEDAYFVKFNSHDYYYACAYYNPHDHQEGQTFYYTFCCREEYSWVGYEKETDIPEYYNDTKLMVVFQINKAAVCQNLLLDEQSVHTIENYQMYEPKFQDGFNVAPAVPFEGAFIHLTTSEKSNYYCCSSSPYFDFDAIAAKEINGEMFVIHDHSRKLSSGEVYESNLQDYFGRYYEQLMSIAEEKLYERLLDDGRTLYYLLIPMPAFENLLRNVRGETQK